MKNHSLLGPPSWVTASTKRSCKSWVQRRRGFGSAVKTRQGSPLWLETPPCKSSCPTTIPSWGCINLGNILVFLLMLKWWKLNDPTSQKDERLKLWNEIQWRSRSNPRWSEKVVYYPPIWLKWWKRENFRGKQKKWWMKLKEQKDYRTRVKLTMKMARHAFRGSCPFLLFLLKPKPKTSKRPNF